MTIVLGYLRPKTVLGQIVSLNGVETGTKFYTHSTDGGVLSTEGPYTYQGVTFDKEGDIWMEVDTEEGKRKKMSPADAGILPYLGGSVPQWHQYHYATFA